MIGPDLADIPYHVIGPLPDLVLAGSDADLGPPGATVTLAHTRLQLTGSFDTSRDFIIGHPDYGPSYRPSGPVFILHELTPEGEIVEHKPPAGGPGWIDTNGFDFKINGVVTSYQKLYKEGEGTLWLTGANVWHAVPEVEAGVLMGDTRSLATDIVNRGWVSFMQAMDGGYTHVISGSGGLRKLGEGMLSLQANQTFTGATEIEAGTLRLTLGNALHTSGAVNVAKGATLDTSLAHEPYLQNLSGAGRVHLGTSMLTLANDRETVFAGTLDGPGEVRVTGGKTLTLTGENTHAGGTRVSKGQLAIAADAALGQAGTPLTLEDAGSVILLADLDTARPWIVGRGVGTVDTGGHTLILHSPLSGHAISFNKAGGGELILTASAQLAGRWVIQAGRLTLQGRGALDPAAVLELHDEAQFDMSAADGARQIRSLFGDGVVTLGEHTLTLSGGYGRFAGTIAGAGGLTIAGPSSYQELSGVNTFTGPTTILTGTLRARPASLSQTVINHGRLELFDHGGLDDISAYSGDISGSGQVIKTDRSVIWLRGRNTYTGGTRVDAGVLMGNTDSLQGDVETHAGLAFYQVADGTYAGRVSGTGTLMSFGPGALTLTGDNTHSGGTAFSNTLRVSRDANLGSHVSGLLIAGGTLVALDDLTLNREVAAGHDGAHFDSNGFSIRLDGRIDGPGGVTKLGEGVLYLAGTHGYAGPTVVQAGGLVVNGSLAGDVEVWEGAWFQALGKVGGNLNLAAGAGFSAGNSPGTLSIAGDFLARGEILVEIAGPDLYDQILVGGRADLTGATLHFALLPGARPEDARHISFLTAAGGTVGLDRVAYRFSSGLDGLGVVMQGNTLLLAPVPEPETWAMLLAGLGLVGLMVSRRLDGSN